MSYFVYGFDKSYSEYLQTKSYLYDYNLTEQRIRIDISKHIREIIATPEYLTQHSIEFKELIHGNDTFDSLTYELQQMISYKGEITGKFHCAFNNMKLQTSESLNKAEVVDRTLLQSSAYRSYELARSYFGQGLYRAAHDELHKAIAENKSVIKPIPDWQFYQMLSVLYLGFADCDFSLVDLAKAEQAFLTVAQNTKDEHPYESAKAFMTAGWAAYCQGKLADASDHTENAILLSRTLAEARFIMAKILIAQKDTDKAFVYLSKAIESDPFYAIKAAGEIDLQQYEASLENLLITIRDKYAFYLSNLSSAFDSAITDKDVAEMLHNEVESIISDQSLHNYVTEYKRLCKAVWIAIEGSYVVSEIRNVIVKQENWYSNKVIEQVKDEHDILTINYSLIGKKHSIDLSFACNLIVYEAEKFFISRTHVTQALWNAVMGAKHFPVSGANYPAYEVNWYDSIKFCNRLSKLLNLPPYYHINHDYNPLDWTKGYIDCDFRSDGFRLPTESEWEYAAKGGSYTHKYPYSGSNEPNDVAWYDKNSKEKIQPTAQKKPNELGLYDMSGNVWEWCWNNWNETDRRILRGGAFCSSSSLCAVSGRGHGNAANPGIANGFRLVRNTVDTSYY